MVSTAAKGQGSNSVVKTSLLVLLEMELDSRVHQARSSSRAQHQRMGLQGLSPCTTHHVSRHQRTTVAMGNLGEELQLDTARSFVGIMILHLRAKTKEIKKIDINSK